MSELDLLKLLDTFSEDVDLADFTPEELQDLVQQKYDGGAPRPLTPEEFKARYFDYYDDVKDKSLKKQDW